MTSAVYEANIDPVKEKQLHDVLREWLRSFVDTAGGQRRLDAATGIKYPQISVALGGGKVSWRMLALISEMPGMSMARVFDQLAGRCLATERSAGNTDVVPVETATPDGGRVRLVPVVPVPASVGPKVPAEDQKASDADAPTSKRRRTRKQ